MKKELLKKQSGRDALSGEILPTYLEGTDIDHIVPRAEGGEYTEENLRVLSPVEHMKRHGTYRTREENLDVIKSLIDDRRTVLSTKNALANQLRAFEKRHTDNLLAATAAFLRAQLEVSDERLDEIEKTLAKAIKTYRKVDPLTDQALNVKGLSTLTVAALLAYVDLAKADSASSLWKYTGLHAASHERYQKGETSGGNKTLRTVLWNCCDSMIKGRGAYRPVYDATKKRLETSEVITTSRNTQGKLVQLAWRDVKPCHRDGAARRAMMKHLLADYWFVGRTALGLSTRPLYVEEKLGHTGIIRPEERGWKVSPKKTPTDD